MSGRFDAAAWPAGPRSLADRAAKIEALTSLRLDEVASAEGEGLLGRAAERAAARAAGRPGDSPSIRREG
jgi:hypothetical protein